MKNIKENLKEFNDKFSHVPEDIKKIIQTKIKSGEFDPHYARNDLKSKK